MTNQVRMLVVPPKLTDPIVWLRSDDSSPSLGKLVFGDHYPEHNELGITVLTNEIQAAHDDIALLRGDSLRNTRAQYVWTKVRHHYDTGLAPSLNLDLRGTFVFFGFERGTGATTDFPEDIALDIIRTYYGEEVDLENFHRD